MVVVAIAIGAILFWQWDVVHTVYLKEQLTDMGLVINGSIIGLFLLGMAKMIWSFLVYSREEGAVAQFARNLERKQPADPMRGVWASSAMARRFATMRRLHEANTPINQSALASALVASESTKTSFPKFINNTLILSGVFGTIVSLSMALIGASDLLENAVNTAGMGMVVHGMSTALSTTITAIVCYLYFGYFYLKLTDAQTNLISAVEQITTSHLMPQFHVHTDTVLYEFTGLIRSLQGAVHQMEESQRIFQEVERRLFEALEENRGRMSEMNNELTNITRLLRIGFRLRDDE